MFIQDKDEEIRELTPEEEAKWLEEIHSIPAPINTPSQRDRLEALESAMLALLGGKYNV